MSSAYAEPLFGLLIMPRRKRVLDADRIIKSIHSLVYIVLFLWLFLRGCNATNHMLLYSTQSDIRIANMTKPLKIDTIVKNLEQGGAVDFLFRRNLLCWSDQAAEVIECAVCNGTHAGEKMKIVSEGLITPTGIAIDWYTDKIYWTDGESSRIEVISIDRKFRKVLFWSDVDLARAIALVPMKGLIFWTDWGEIPKIERASMDGKAETRKVIVKDNIYWPNSMVVDYEKNLLYWVDAKLKFVDVMDFDGGSRKRIVNNGLEYPYALAFMDNTLYWTDWTTWSIHTYDMSTEGPIVNLIDSKPVVPVDITVHDPLRQPPPAAVHPCLLYNGNCSHLCLLSSEPPGFSCVCPTGIKLMANSSTMCHSGPQALLVVAQRTSISKISLDSPDFTANTIPLKGVKRAITVDYDPITEYLYWGDNIAKTISRARLDGSDQSTVVQSGAGMPDCIAVDSVARNLYWTDPVTDTISVARLDGAYRKVLIHEDLYEPRAIAVHPTGGWMFWSDWNEKRPKIERSSLDGTERVLLVSERLVWPNAIALDTDRGRLYWGDARTHKIEVCNMDGTDRSEIHSNDISHIFGLALLDDYLYWTDIQRRSLDRINKDTGLERQSVVEEMANMMGVKAFHLKHKPQWNPCVANNGNCSHLCFNRPHNYVCGCPLGLELYKNKRSCVEPEAFLLYGRRNIIGRLSIENDGNDAVLPLKEIKEVSALAIHVSESKLYWSDSKTKTINRCSINGSNMERILDWAGLVEGLAVDWPAQNIYWTDTAAHRIEVARLDGSSRRTLIWQGLKKPKSIVLDPKKGYMYWSELGSKSIKRAGMDGSSPTIVLEQIGRANSLTIDYEKRTLYWVTLDPPAIEFADLDGRNRRKLITENVPMPYVLTLFHDNIYWGDWNTGDVEVAKKSDGSRRQLVYSKLDYLSDLKVFHKSRQTGANQCAVDNGGCSQLCLATPPADARASADYRCGCPTHYRLKADNLTCAEPEEFLLFAQKNALFRIMVGGGDSPDAPIPITGLKNIRAIDFDPVHRNLYWIDDDSHAIRMLGISSSSASAVNDATVVVSGLSRPFHIVVDVYGRALYWTCTDTDSINATALDNSSSTGVILRGHGLMPRYLAMHQTKRLLIWTDAGLGVIMCAAVDGSSRKELAKAANATALTVDQNTGYIYWAVARQIHSIDINGNNKRMVWQGAMAVSLATYGGALYLASASPAADRPLMRLALGRRESPAGPVPHALRVVAVTQVHKVDRSDACWEGGVCGAGPGRCVRGGCGCGTGCEPEPPRRACEPDLLCPVADTCIPHQWKCDGEVDCPDGSDEASCGPCARGVRCADGTCGAALGDCDAGARCADGELPEAFRCTDGTCLAARLLCDRVRHCDDGADEAPTVCDYAGKEPVQHRNSNALTGAGAILGVAAVILAGWAIVRKWRGGETARRDVDTEMSASRRLYPRKPVDGSYASERRRPLGASVSVSDSSCERYPRETLNPPPSPATESSLGVLGGRRRAYRHYRAMNRPPPPTPCSTDACESDCAGIAPPPTPCHTSPPSPSAPSSRSSTYFSPFPPPPSPAPHLSDS